MSLNVLAVVALPALVGLLIVAAAGYFMRFELPRPPIGTFGWSDIAVMSAVVIIAPFCYLALPRVVVAGLFGLVVLVAIQLTLAPLLGGRIGTVVAVALCGAVGLAAVFGQTTLTAWLSGAALAVALAQYGLWRLRGRQERSTWEWREGVSATACGTDPLASLESTLTPIPTGQFTEGTWLAMRDGLVLGSGASAGLALRAARRNGHAGVLFARQV